MKYIRTVFSVTLLFGIAACNNVNNNKAADNAGKKTTENNKKEMCSAPMSPADSAKLISHVLEVKGEVEHALNLTVDSLKQIKSVLIDDKVACQNGTAPKEGKSCRGVLLKDILDKAKIKQTGHKDRNFYIIARATDNYLATFSWAEIFNNINGDNTFVLFEEDGQPIKQRGEFMLTCNTDLKTGVRHVRWLKSIEVYRVN